MMKPQGLFHVRVLVLYMDVPTEALSPPSVVFYRWQTLFFSLPIFDFLCFVKHFHGFFLFSFFFCSKNKLYSIL